MVTIAASLYLPEHIAVIARRAYYYIAGDSEVTSSQKLAQTAVKTAATAAAQAFSSSVASASASAPTTAVKGVVDAVTARAGGEL